jgi:predicted nucleic acid-binding Zn ribbon protein
VQTAGPIIEHLLDETVQKCRETSPLLETKKEVGRNALLFKGFFEVRTELRKCDS